MSKSNYQSRTLHLCWGILIIATALAAAEIITGVSWVTASGTVLVAWQARRYGDNRLRAGGDE